VSEENEIAIACAEQMYREDRATHAMGIQVDVRGAGEAVATLDIGDEHLNGFGICHGGVIYALADTAFAFACNGFNDLTVSAGGQIDYLRPVSAGERLVAVATPDAQSGRQRLYTAEVRNGDGELVALFRGRGMSRGEPLLK
jgi:acyl-CoA thioesterase